MGGVVMGQLALFEPADAPRDWEREWQNMPEFKMGNTEPFQKITINFASWEDVKRFGAALGLPVTRRTDSLWFPKPEAYIAPKNFRYIDDEP